MTRIFEPAEGLPSRLETEGLSLHKNETRVSHMYPKVACTAHRRDLTFNTCQRCAERNLIRELMLEAGRQGVHSSCLARWIHRKYGDLIVVRQLGNGDMGTSLPCVVCRKVLDRMAIQWRAHIGPKWIRSTDPDVPESRPTHKQRQSWKNSLT
jgi:hypothetical protein